MSYICLYHRSRSYDKTDDQKQCQLIGHNLLQHKPLASCFSTCQLCFTPPAEIHPELGLALLDLAVGECSGYSNEYEDEEVSHSSGVSIGGVTGEDGGSDPRVGEPWRQSLHLGQMKSFNEDLHL